MYPKELKAEWFGQTFSSKGEEYRIVGANIGRTKFDVSVIRLRDNMPLGFTHDGVFHAFNPDGAMKAKRAEYETNLRFHATADPDYPAIDASLIGAELVSGAKVIGLSDLWIRARTQVIVERKDGTLGAIRAKDFGPSYIKAKAEPKAAA
jgi:hypothetical protein